MAGYLTLSRKGRKELRRTRDYYGRVYGGYWLRLLKRADFGQRPLPDYPFREHATWRGRFSIYLALAGTAKPRNGQMAAWALENARRLLRQPGAYYKRRRELRVLR